jgi:ADP-ribosylglycohydrolase
MIGAIAGDVIGSVYEMHPIKMKNFALFSIESQFTDDTVLTCAVALSILTGQSYLKTIRELGQRYPHAGYGPAFRRWLSSPTTKPYGSNGNGSAMRVSPIGFAYNTEEEVLAQATASAMVTHDHPEGIKGAKATALSIFLARKGSQKEKIRSEIAIRFDYNLDRTVKGIRPEYKYDVTCAKTVPEAIISFLDSDSYEDTIRNAISLGGDSDTLACIAGGIAEAYYKTIPDEIANETEKRLPSDLRAVLNAFEKKHGVISRKSKDNQS